MLERMRRASLFCCIFLPSLGLMSTGCCWPGHVLSRGEIGYSHPAVRWVYRAGGQIGNVLYFVVPIENIVRDLQIGEGCVVIEEGPFGCIEQGPYRPQYAVRLQDGKRISGELVSRQYTFVGFAEQAQNTFEVDEHTLLSFASRPRCDQMFAEPADSSLGPSTLLLTLTSHAEGFGWVRYMVRPRKTSSSSPEDTTS